MGLRIGVLAQGTPSFTTLTFAGNHAAFSGVQVPRYWKDVLGFVHIEGSSLASGAIAATAALFSNALPVGMRPLARRAIQLQSLADYVIYVETNGTITTAAALTSGEVLCFDYSFIPLV